MDTLHTSSTTPDATAATGSLHCVRLNLIGWLCLAACLLLPAVANANVTAQVDRNTINEGDTFTLTLTVSNSNHAQPDLSPLHRDFDVLGTSQNSMIQIINGSISSNQTWTITLSPKRTGKLNIPPITVGNTASNALSVTVLPASASSGGGTNQAADVFLDVSVKPAHKSYVQQQLLYTVRLYYADPLSQGTLSVPSLDNAVIQKLGKDRYFSTERDGRQYQVIERRYAIFPQQSGKLVIPAVVFDGQVQTPSAQTGNTFNSFFNNFNPPTRHMHLRSRKLELQIAVQPTNYQGNNWLPAQQIKLTEAWSPTNPQFRVGEPITRSIIIHAKGLSSSQLPNLHMPPQAGLKLYPDQPQTHDQADGDTLDATRIQKIAMIPTRVGDLSLPAIHLTWWNTKTHKQQTSSLPAETIHVLPGAGTANTINAPATPVKQHIAAAPVQTKPARKAPAALKSMPTGAPAQYLPSNRIWIFLTILFAGAWLITLLLWWRRRKQKPAPPASPVIKAMHTSPQQCSKQVRLACQQHDPQAVKTALLDWAKAQWPETPPLSLGALAKQVHNAALADAITNLERNLYTTPGTAWRADNLLSQFDSYLKQSNQHNSADTKAVLAPLYPPRKQHATGRR